MKCQSALICYLKLDLYYLVNKQHIQLANAAFLYEPRKDAGETRLDLFFALYSFLCVLSLKVGPSLRFANRCFLVFSASLFEKNYQATWKRQNAKVNDRQRALLQCDCHLLIQPASYLQHGQAAYPANLSFGSFDRQVNFRHARSISRCWP